MKLKRKKFSTANRWQKRTLRQKNNQNLRLRLRTRKRKTVKTRKRRRKIKTPKNKQNPLKQPSKKIKKRMSQAPIKVEKNGLKRKKIWQTFYRTGKLKTRIDMSATLHRIFSENASQRYRSGDQQFVEKFS